MENNANSEKFSEKPGLRAKQFERVREKGGEGGEN